jgi:hypothetical protein
LTNSLKDWIIALFFFGDVPERSNGTVCKTVKPPVQIRTSPPKYLSFYSKSFGI